MFPKLNGVDLLPLSVVFLLAPAKMLFVAPVLAPRPVEAGGGPAGVVDVLPNRFDGAGVVRPAALVLGVFAGVPKEKVAGVEELL